MAIELVDAWPGDLGKIQANIQNRFKRRTNLLDMANDWVHYLYCQWVRKGKKKKKGRGIASPKEGSRWMKDHEDCMPFCGKEEEGEEGGTASLKEKEGK